MLTKPQYWDGNGQERVKRRWRRHCYVLSFLSVFSIAAIKRISSQNTLHQAKTWFSKVPHVSEPLFSLAHDNNITSAALERLEHFQPLRGVRYLYEQYGLLLVVPPKNGNDPLYIVDAGHHPEEVGITCANLVLRIWVRLAGEQQVVAGFATKYKRSDASGCTWQFHHEPLPPGSYEIAVKVLALNDDGRDVRTDLCYIQEKLTVVEGAQEIERFTAPGDFYGEREACCEICTLHPNCTHFAATNTKPQCVLYSNNSLGGTNHSAVRFTDVNDTDKTTHWVGTSRNKTDVMRFLGCGYSQTMEMSFCLGNGTDDMPYIVKPVFHVSVDESTKEAMSTTTLPLCPANLKGVSHGRWVRSATDLNCSMKLVQPTVAFPQYVHNESQPEACWVHDKLIGNLCLDGCARNPKSNLWKSSLAAEDYFTYTWHPYSCHLPLYSDGMIKTCFQRYNYSMPQIKGDSVPHFFSLYVANRLDGLTREENDTNVTIFGNKRVVIHNFMLLHHIWHDSNEQFQALLSGWSANGFPEEASEDGGENFWLNGPFLSSERQTHVTHGRLVALTDMARPALVARGWKELDWVNVSMALSYESATQYDGLHVVGNAMKMLFHMLMHALCSDTNGNKDAG